MDITRRDHKQTFQKPTTLTHQFQLKPFQGYILEVEDEHFHHDSAVLLPNYPPDQRKPDGPSLGLAVLAESLKHQKAKPDQTVLIAGHADTTGADKYNLEISLKRANAVLHAIMGERAEWVAIADSQHKVEDYQLILTWIADVYGWDCDPHGVDNNAGSKTQTAMENFKTTYNDVFQASIPVDGSINAETWGAFFDLYMDMVENLCETDNDGLAELRAKLKFIGPKVVGCGEHWPIERAHQQNYRSKINRRVEILFFDPGQEPTLNCHPGAACTPILCELYNHKMYRFKVLPVGPSTPKPVEVYLKLTYIGPEDAKTTHVFPPDFTVNIVWKDGTTHPATMQKNGLLQFGVPRSQGSFTLNFETVDIYVSAGPAGSAGQEKTGSTADLADLHKNNHQFFKVPAKWTLKQSEWAKVSGTHYDETNFLFNLPKNLFGVTLGSNAAPEELRLDPHWTYTRFEFFDRFFGHTAHNHERVNVPVTLLDGWRTSPAAGDPDTRSHWTIRDDQREKSVHAIPWILQFQEDRTEDKRPSKDIQLGFKTDDGTHVVSDSGTSRKVDVVTDANKLKPSADRLKLYDLPKKWNSALYFTRYADKTGDFFESVPAARLDAFQNADTPLIFSLDDLVLTDSSFHVIDLAANESPAIFFHQFKDPGAGFPGTYSVTGVYKPGDDVRNNKYFPYSKIQMPVTHYINDYPNWTRLVLAQGNAFDAFDSRTPDAAGTVVGARAAVRWADASLTAVHQAVNGTVTPPGRTISTPNAFFAIEPFFLQKNDMHRGASRAKGVYQEWVPNGGYSGGTWDNGRVDLMMLRDCDITSDNKEYIVNFHYIRLRLDYSSAPPEFHPADQDRFRQNVVTNIPARWNGNDAVNAAQPKLKPSDNNQPIAGAIRWFLQDLPIGKEHFHVTVKKIDRAFMSGSDGTASYNTDDDQAKTAGDPKYPAGWFTAAHECGHGDTLLDEYNEKNMLGSYYDRSFASWIDGDPYEDDRTAIMNGNISPMPRHYWHAVEWMHALTGTEFDLDIGGVIYKLPHHPSTAFPDLRTFVNWPYWAEVGVAAPHARQNFDMYLYALGNEPYANKLIDGKTLKGLLMVETKILVVFDDPHVKFSTIRSTLNEMTKAVTNKFCKQFVAANAVVNGSGVDLSPCLVQFRPRYLVSTFPSNFADADELDSLTKFFDRLDIQSGTPPQLVQVPKTEPQRTQFLTNTAPGLYAKIVSDTQKNMAPYFRVNIDGSHTTGWDHLGLLASMAHPDTVPSTMKLKDSGSRGPDFVPFFGDMVGLDTSAGMPAAAELKSRIQNRIFRRVMSNATVA